MAAADLKLGLNPHRRPNGALLQVRWTTGTPLYRPAADNMTGIIPGLDGNDRYGDCGPTAADNHERITTRTEVGTQLNASLTEVLALYSASTTPPFDPATGANDDGVYMPDLLGAMRTVGLGGRTIVAYGKLADISDASIFAAIDLFGAVLFAVDLQVAQQKQTDDGGPWDYVPRSGEWGGHAVVAGAYDSTRGSVDVFTWAMRVSTTEAFRAHRLSEVWVPLYQSVIDSNRFNTTVAVAALAADFKALTGTDWPVPLPPAPVPPNPDVPQADRDLAAAFRKGTWLTSRHVGANAEIQHAAATWLQARGL